ncbi:hypothetical protein HN865_02290 [Candidatus Woesearchaeota archaeon]|jgi:hypothetical protein|nr:hypothetical protein [archaeon]MBT7237663.1 hypothetical protein [Candidatus Woesearchaeota archaeon]
MTTNEELFSSRMYFTKKYKKKGEDYFTSMGGRVMIFSELDVNDKKLTLVFIDTDKLIFGFSDKKEHDYREIKLRSMSISERPF